MSEDLADRIERAARAILAIVPIGYGMTKEEATAYATVSLTAAYPELFSTPSTHWLAPWDLDREQAYILDTLSWGEFRDAHLKEQAE